MKSYKITIEAGPIVNEYIIESESKALAECEALDTFARLHGVSMFAICSITRIIEL